MPILALTSEALPAKPQLLLVVGVANLVVQDRVIANVAFYDDRNTARAIDRVEVYATNGQLVALGWYDEFGIERTAIELSLVDGATDLKGMFIVWVAGKPV